MSVAPDKVRNSMLMGENLGIPFAPDKCEGPTPVLTFLGIELDCVNLEARLPQVKISNAINLIQSFLQSPRQRYSRLESLHGFLNHCAEIIPAGKAFLRSLQRLLHPSSSHWVTIPSQVVLDLQTFYRIMMVKPCLLGWVGTFLLFYFSRQTAQVHGVAPQSSRASTLLFSGPHKSNVLTYLC